MKESLRKEISHIDREIVRLIALRLVLAAEIGKVKGEKIRDRNQEARVIKRAKKWAEEYGISTDFAEKVLSLLIHESLRIQLNIKR